jgi:hypothetical protein
MPSGPTGARNSGLGSWRGEVRFASGTPVAALSSSVGGRGYRYLHDAGLARCESAITTLEKDEREIAGCADV